MLGLSVLGWAVAGMVACPPAERLSPERITITALNAGVGLLLLLRTRPVLHGSPVALLASIPSLVLAGVAIKLAPRLGDWPGPVSGLFGGGGLLALLAFAWLGRSFAVLPSLRKVVVRGPYRLVRHPAYLGELLMVCACGLAAGGPLAWALPPLALALLAVRIRAEERVLAISPAYGEYKRRVRSRLIPGIW